jgi:hypothetical protein
VSTQKPQSNRRWWILLPLLAACVWLALFADKSPAVGAAVGVPAAAVPAARPPETIPATYALLALVPREQLFAPPGATNQGKGTTRDLFSARNWTPPPAPPAVSAAAPVAPPVPYAFLGKKLEAEFWEVYLSRGEQTFVARTGQVLEGEWRVDQIAPPKLALTYLPLAQTQTFSIGEAR